jgi:hypothetical protein
MKLKKFNEFFDTEELKSRHEIDYLSGNIKKLIGKKVEWNFKDENISNLISKMADLHLPFLRAFVEADGMENSKMSFDTFDIMVRYDDESKFYNFLVMSGATMLVLGLRIKSMNNYDIYVYLDSENDVDSLKVFEENNVTYDDVVSIIKDLYIPELVDCGFDKLLDYDYERYYTSKN